MAKKVYLLRVCCSGSGVRVILSPACRCCGIFHHLLILQLPTLYFSRTYYTVGSDSTPTVSQVNVLPTWPGNMRSPARSTLTLTTVKYYEPTELTGVPRHSGPLESLD